MKIKSFCPAKSFLIPLVLIIALKSVQAQPTIVAPTMNNTPFGNVTVPIMAANWIGVFSLDLDISWNPNAITYIGYQNVNPLIPQGFLVINLAGESVHVAWFGLTPVTLAQGTLFDLNLIFNACTPITLTSTSMTTVNGYICNTTGLQGNVNENETVFT